MNGLRAGRLQYALTGRDGVRPPSACKSRDELLGTLVRKMKRGLDLVDKLLRLSAQVDS